MPPRRKITLLPGDLRRELDAALIESAFSNYRGLADWLAGKGYRISKSALHDYGTALESRIERIRYATEQAEALVAAVPDDGLALADASIRLAQEQIYSLLYHAESGDLKATAGAARAIADTIRASISLRRDRREVLAEAAEAAGGAAARLGLSGDTAAAIRAAIEGVAP